MGRGPLVSMADSSKWKKRGHTAMIDRISNLPDTLLCHILSFLPTKVAVRTSILSKRWRLLWSKVPVLDFDVKLHESDGVSDEKTQENFVRFVNTYLIARDARRIRKFCLKHDNLERDSIIVRTWVNAAICCKAEHLDISLGLEWFEFPKSVYTCRTFEILKFLCLSLSEITSSAVHFPMLKILCIDTVTFSCSNDVMEILFGCPVLEQLGVKDTVIQKHGLSPWHRSGIKFPNLVKAKIGLDNKEADNRIASSIPMFCKVSDLELTFFNYCWDMLPTLLGHCPMLKILVIDKSINQPCQSDSKKHWMRPQNVPECVSHLKKICSRLYEDLERELKLTRYFLDNAILLEIMTICSDDNLVVEAKLKIITNLSAILRSPV